MKNTEKTRREIRCKEMGWDDTNCSDNGMQRPMSKKSCDAMGPDEMRKDSIFRRHRIRLTDKSRARCCTAQTASPRPPGTVIAPIYRLQAFQF